MILSTIYTIICIWVIQAAIACMINPSNIKINITIKEFFLLTCLPYTLYCKIFNPKKLV